MLIAMCSNSSPLSHHLDAGGEHHGSGGGKNCGLKNVVAMTCHSTIIPTIDAT